MFGYVKTDMPNMYVKDTVLYKAMYCGLCKSIGCVCGAKGRFCLNYDLTFLSTLLHNLADIDVKIEKQGCVLHTIKKRPIAVPDELSKKIGAFNVILAYHKLNDDVNDLNKGRIKRSFFKSSYKKAKKFTPELDEIVLKMYKGLSAYEKTGGDSIDISADFFANMMVDAVKYLIGDKATDPVINLSYDMGKWIYLIDALDDFDKDKKTGNFNVFANIYKGVSCKKELMQNHGAEVLNVFAYILNSITENAKQLDYKFNHDLTDNILYCGLREQTKTVMECKKCKKTIKS